MAIKFWIQRKKINSQKNFLIFGNFFENILIFQIFNELCILRRWKRLKIVRIISSSDFIIMGVAPKHKRLQNNVEIFLPVAFSTSVICLKYLFNFTFLKIEKIFPEKNFMLNLAFLDRDSTVAYYKVFHGVKKITGPFI